MNKLNVTLRELHQQTKTPIEETRRFYMAKKRTTSKKAVRKTAKRKTAAKKTVRRTAKKSAARR